MDTHRIVRVGSLDEFIAEVPALKSPEIKHLEHDANGFPLFVRLSLTDVDVQGAAGTAMMTAKEFALHLQGVNTLGEIVWLMESHRTIFEEGMFRSAMLEAYTMVKAHLLSTGYEVRGGSFGLPKDVEPVRGSFREVFRWVQDKSGDEPIWRVVPVEGEQ